MDSFALSARSNVSGTVASYHRPFGFIASLSNTSSGRRVTLEPSGLGTELLVFGPAALSGLAFRISEASARNETAALPIPIKASLRCMVEVLPLPNLKNRILQVY